MLHFKGYGREIAFTGLIVLLSWEEIDVKAPGSGNWGAIEVLACFQLSDKIMKETWQF